MAISLFGRNYGLNPIQNTRNSLGFVADVVSDRDVIKGFDPFTGNRNGGSQPTNNPVNAQTKSPQNTASTSSYGSGGGSGGGTASAADLAYFDDQINRLRAQLGSTQSTLNNGLTSLNDSYNRETSKANEQRSRALADFGVQREDTTRKKQTALGQVDTNARTLADSLRRKLGMASGSSSSAYQLAAPNAVAREASQNRNSVMGNFAENFRDLDTAENRAKSDFESLLEDLSLQRRERERGLREGVLQKEQEINSSLAQAAAQRAQAAGGGYAQARAAMQPYSDAITSRQASIDQLFNQFRTPFNVKEVQVQNPELRDYLVDRAGISANQQAGTQDPYSPFRRPFGREEESYL